jgi:uncharacterized protein (TIGR03118 family)
MLPKVMLPKVNALIVPAAFMLALSVAQTALAQVYPIRTERDGMPNWEPLPAKTDYDKRNAYALIHLVATDERFKPQFMVDPLIGNAWGLTIRPAGKGGHWWITNANSGTTTTYVGDAPGHPFGQDDLKVVPIPVGKLHAVHPELKSQPTGQVYAGWNKGEFVTEADGVKGGSKFIFVTLDGTISGWTDGQKNAVTMIDVGEEGAMFTGVAITEHDKGNRLYACDFNTGVVRVYGPDWKPVETAGKFKDPKIDDGYAIYNMHYLNGKLYATWGRIAGEPGDAEPYPGYGFVSEFDTEGNLLRSLEHRRELNAPWGLVIAPKDFGPLSGRLLVGNFGDGRVLAYNLETAKFDDYLRGIDGKPVEIDGLWGMLFGNGESLGYRNHLYYAAGPEVENEGVFGKLVPLFP